MSSAKWRLFGLDLNELMPGASNMEDTVCITRPQWVNFLNCRFYFEDIRAVDILSGGVPPPDSCSELYDVLDQHKEILAKMVLATAKREAVRQVHKARDGTGILQRVRVSGGKVDGRRKCFTNPMMHLSHIPQYTIQNRNVQISVLNGVLWDMGQVHCGISDIDLLE